MLNELWMTLSLCVDACSGGGGRVVGLTKPRYAGLKSSLTVNISRLVKISNKPWSPTIQTVSPLFFWLLSGEHRRGILQPADWRPKTLSSEENALLLYASSPAWRYQHIIPLPDPGPSVLSAGAGLVWQSLGCAVCSAVMTYYVFTSSALRKYPLQCASWNTYISCGVVRPGLLTTTGGNKPAINYQHPGQRNTY